MKLFFYRDSQNRSLIDAVQDGAIRFLGEFENTSQADVAMIESIKLACVVTAESLDAGETLMFVEVEAGAAP